MNAMRNNSRGPNEEKDQEVLAIKQNIKKMVETPISVNNEENQSCNYIEIV